MNTDIRQHLKKFSTELGLTPIGFVPIDQAIAYKLKQDEGVPPSVILIGYTKKSLVVSIYKVGKCICRRSIHNDPELLHSLEQSFQKCGEEVLPSRMLLYGLDTKHLEALKSEMTGYPWTSKVNFLHFPKIEIVSSDTAVSSISIAGASELKRTVSDTPGESETEGAGGDAESDGVQPGTLPEKVPSKEAESDTEGPSGSLEDSRDDAVQEEKPLETESEAANGDKEPEYAIDDVANIRYVAPESMGFMRNTDVLEYQAAASKGTADGNRSRETDSEEADSESFIRKDDQTGRKMDIPSRISSLLVSISRTLPRFNVPMLKGREKLNYVIIGIAIIAIAGSVFGYIAFVYPSADITVTLSNRTVSETVDVVIDPEASSVDPVKKIIPGRIQEIEVNGEKTVPATGKKKIGDPAKGTVTIYNKSLSSRTFRKGSVLISGKLEFKLDDEVRVASASESIGSITFGKADASITASEIGSQGNLPAGTEFSFDDVSPSVAIARNDKELSGGSSRDIIVVSRTDYDSLVKAVTNELIGKAKDNLKQKVSPSQKLIDDTITTEVTEKIFQEEIDQQAKEVHGTIKLTVSGIAYDESDLRQIFAELTSSKVPDGYKLDQEGITTEMKDLKTNKDDTIGGTVSITGVAIPQFSADEMKRRLTGKGTQEAEELIKASSGVSDVKIIVHNPLFGGLLPVRENSISISVQSK
jgi:hypothetical protein